MYKRQAYYIVENETEQDYLDSKLYGHVTQTLLPDQYLTYDGKYYKVKYISCLLYTSTSGSYSDVKIIIISSTQVGSEAWTGKQDVTIPFKDDRSWMEQNLSLIHI